MSLESMIRERGLKKGWIAEQLGIRQDRLSHILYGRQPFPSDKISALAKALRITVAEARNAVDAGDTAA